MSLNDQIQTILLSQQINLFGVADLRPYEKDLVQYGGQIVKGFTYGISIGIKLNDSIVNGLANRMDCNNASLYYSHVYTIINNRLDIATSTISSFLIANGHQALPMPAAERTDIENAISTVSHKMIAHIAGLGWIGKNCLLVTPEYGPRVRLSTILTTAELECTGHLMDQRCGTCVECMNACPTKAILGRNYVDGEDRSYRLNFKACQDYFDEMRKDEKRKPVCGMCLFICPHGRKSKSK